MRGMQEGGGGCFSYIKVPPPYNSRSGPMGGVGVGGGGVNQFRQKECPPCPPDMLRTAVGTEPDTLAHTR